METNDRDDFFDWPDCKNACHFYKFRNCEFSNDYLLNLLDGNAKL